MKALGRCVAALVTIGLLGCSSVNEDCRDCAAGGSGGTGGAGAGAVAGAGGGQIIIDETFCDPVVRMLVAHDDDVCTFDLAPKPTQDWQTSYDLITIFTDGSPLGRDTQHEWGWDYVDASKMSITLYGAACDQVKTGEIVQVQVAFICLEA
jgi:hypothetical protein